MEHRTDHYVPEPHAAFLKNAIDRLKQDERLVGIAVGESYASGAMDEFSDLDILIAVEPAAYESVLGERQAIARTLGPC